MSKQSITRHTLSDLRKIKGKTDWNRVDALTEQDLEEAIAADPDADIDWSTAELVTPHKTQISIRLDDDVIDFFKKGGSGYQTRINTILRHFMEQKKRKTG